MCAGFAILQGPLMPGPKVRADYEALKNVAQGFSQAAEATAQSLQLLKRQMDTLNGGDWIGQGASAFYAEMNDQVLPTFQRLHSALQTSADVTLKIGQAMKNAEDEAAKVLRGDSATGALGAAAASGAGSGGATSGGAGSGGAGSGGAASSKARDGEPVGGAPGGGAAGGAPAPQVDPRLKPVQDKIDKGDKEGAISAAIKEYKIDTRTAKAGSPKFNASTSGEGETAKDGTVDIGSKAFSSPGWLASSIGHELVHTQQVGDRWYTDAQGTHINEIEAYDWEINHAPENGLSAAEIATLNKRRTSHYDKLNAANKAIIDGGSYKLPPPPAAP